MTWNRQTLTSTLDAIGFTPLVELNRFNTKARGNILAKLESLNPGFSKKDRIARQIIEDAEKDGTLKYGQTVVELTSGNTGTGLAITCAVKGYPFVAVMSKGNSSERGRMMAALGAEVVLVNQAKGSRPGEVSGADLDLVEIRTREIVDLRRAFRADQFNLAGNFRAHYLHTAREIIEQTGGRFDAFCDFVGSGGTFSGCAKAFKELNPNIECYVVEPEGAAVLAGEKVSNPAHPIQGGGYAKPELQLLEMCLIDGFVKVSAREAVSSARRLARQEGIFAGISSGANVYAAQKLLQGPCRGYRVVTFINDSGLKYLSTQLWK